VPNPLPQLADLIIPPHPIKLGRSLAAWSLIKKRPRLHLLFQALLLWLPPSIRLKFTEQAKVATWIDTRFARRYNIALRQLGPQGRYGFWQPSRRDYAQTLVAATRQFAYCSPHTLGCEERRYPFLDQALIEFLLSISPNQLLRPGQRRSLMRRSLANIVPPEILWRKTKGTIARSPLVAFQNTWAELERLLTAPLGAGRGYVDRNRLLDSLHAAKNGNAPQLVRLLKAVFLELWLRSLAEHNVIRLNAESHVTLNKALSPQEVRPWL